MNAEVAVKYLAKEHQVEVTPRWLLDQARAGMVPCIKLAHRTIHFKSFMLDRWIEKHTVK